jgi:hypothetical protein
MSRALLRVGSMPWLVFLQGSAPVQLRCNRIGALPHTCYPGILAPQAPWLPSRTPLCPGLEERIAKKGKRHSSTPETRPLLPPPAAGQDGGAAAQGSGVPAAREAPPGQTWSALTCAWPRLPDGGTAGRVPTVAMASPGVDGMPLLQSRETRGGAGAWVNARPGQPGPGRPTTARCAGRWRQQLQSAGGWAPSLRPPEARCPLRRRLRPREPLRPLTVKPMQPRHQALDHLPLHQHPGLRAVTGVTGRRLLRVLGAGPRAPQACAAARLGRFIAACAAPADRPKPRPPPPIHSPTCFILGGRTQHPLQTGGPSLRGTQLRSASADTAVRQPSRGAALWCRRQTRPPRAVVKPRVPNDTSAALMEDESAPALPPLSALRR